MKVIAIPDVVVPSTPGAWVAAVLLFVCAGLSIWFSMRHRAIPLWLTSAFVIVLLLGFLAWAAAGGVIPMIGLLAGALALATPLVFGALGGVIGERAGVVNIAIEAQLLSGAFSAAVVATLVGSPWAGLVAAMLASVLVALVLGLFAITYYVDQVIVGVVLNVLVIGVTTFMFSTVLSANTATLNSPEPFRAIALPGLSEIPILGRCSSGRP